MERLRDIKNEYAKEKGFDDWDHFTYKMYKFQHEEHMDKVTELYAREVAQAALEKAAEAACVEYYDGKYKTSMEEYYTEIGGSVSVDKESITNESNITLL